LRYPNIPRPGHCTVAQHWDAIISGFRNGVLYGTGGCSSERALFKGRGQRSGAGWPAGMSRGRSVRFRIASATYSLRQSAITATSSSDPREPYLSHPQDPRPAACRRSSRSAYTGRPVIGPPFHLISLFPGGHTLQHDLRSGKAVVRILLFRSELPHMVAVILVIVQRKSCLFSFPSGPTEAILKSRSKRIPRSLLQGAAIEKCAFFCCG
jgi:hypothetical protein